MADEIMEIKVAQLKSWLDNTDITYEQLINFMYLGDDDYESR